jgi:methionyl-tRNA formyltransferase
VKILFFGTNFISKEYLKTLYIDNNDIFVITKSDKLSFRGLNCICNEVKSYSVKNNIDFIQPDIFENDIVDIIKKKKFDIGIVVSYGKLIPKNIFDLPKKKTFNIHFSLLPKYRGATPVQSSLCNGETETGVTSFFLSEKLDSGDILIQEKIDIDINDNFHTLLYKLIPIGINVMKKTINLLKKDNIEITKQVGEYSITSILKKKSGLLDWSSKASEIYNKFRGLCDWPGIYSIFSFGKLSGKRIKFIKIEILNKNLVNDDYGVITSIKKNIGFVISCSIGEILVLKVQLDNRNIVSAWTLIHTGQIVIGDRF